MIDLPKLKALAEKATPTHPDTGLWNCCVTEAEDEEDGYWCSGPICADRTQAEMDNDYIASASPATVLELIAELEEARAELATAREKALEEAAQRVDAMQLCTFSRTQTHAIKLAAGCIRALAKKGK